MDDQLVFFLDLFRTSMTHATTYLGIEKKDLHKAWLASQLRHARYSV
jgi:hypothetical protein